jgi:hypothetical protein
MKKILAIMFVAFNCSLANADIGLHVNVREVTSVPSEIVTSSVLKATAELLERNQIQYYRITSRGPQSAYSFCIEANPFNALTTGEIQKKYAELQPASGEAIETEVVGNCSSQGPDGDSATPECWVHEFSYGGKTCQCTRGYRATYRPNPDRCVNIRRNTGPGGP